MIVGYSILSQCPVKGTSGLPPTVSGPDIQCLFLDVAATPGVLAHKRYEEMGGLWRESTI